MRTKIVAATQDLRCKHGGGLAILRWIPLSRGNPGHGCINIESPRLSASGQSQPTEQVISCESKVSEAELATLFRLLDDGGTLHVVLAGAKLFNLFCCY